ncbi:hypothetical protein JJB09_09830 [Rhizobium sp. KVB221]|uniref:DUF6867 domain-containing protein n=1 Tax=Rhizobium setariae TaxID=2801340 RepID=A0A936YT94_9HYPH|nr:hypothetical protein [Rhizobium setariae]MBL0372327.1 hypothetical protein [Rhizobium setariae]
MQGILYEEPSFWSFAMVTVLIGGWTAWRTGKSVADGWGEIIPHVLIYTLLLGIGIRFVHHALFGGTMFSLHYYAIDTVFLLVLAIMGFRYTRAKQMATKYYWLYEKAGPFAWKKKSV